MIYIHGRFTSTYHINKHKNSYWQSHMGWLLQFPKTFIISIVNWRLMCTWQFWYEFYEYTLCYRFICFHMFPCLYTSGFWKWLFSSTNGDSNIHSDGIVDNFHVKCLETCHLFSLDILCMNCFRRLTVFIAVTTVSNQFNVNYNVT